MPSPAPHRSSRKRRNSRTRTRSPPAGSGPFPASVGSVSLRLLTFHTTYACGHSGACCNAGWVEPVEDGRCRFFETHALGGCTIQHAHGHDWLPHACQQFPRIVTRSPLGTSLTLSAFCPTAASLLFDEGPFAIATADDARRYDGLDARDVMPPLLRADMLMDWDAVARWEELAVGALSDHRDDLDTSIEIIESASAEVCATWSPSAGALDQALTERFARVSEHRACSSRRRGAGEPKSGLACDLLTAPRKTRPTLAPAMARYFAGHAFACWPMYDGRGIAGALGYLRTVRATLNEESARLADDAGRALDAVLLKEAFRQADVRLRHTVTSRP